MLRWVHSCSFSQRGLGLSGLSFFKVPITLSSSGRGGAKPRSVKGVWWAAVLRPSPSGPALDGPASSLGPPPPRLLP